MGINRMLAPNSGFYEVLCDLKEEIPYVRPVNYDKLKFENTVKVYMHHHPLK
jgi:hypothetical protein